MDTRLEALAGFVLDGLIEGNLSDASAYEFAEEICICIREKAELPWGDQLEKLWDFLAGGRTALDGAEQNRDHAFRQGQIYATMELLKMYYQQQEDEFTLEDDAREFDGHRRAVFLALRDGRSMTHGELAVAAGLSDSSLSQFLHKIEKKNYIHFRKVGRTKYYRLSHRGEKLLRYILPERHSGWIAGLPVVRHSYREQIFAHAVGHEYLQYFCSGVQNKMDYKGIYPLAYADSIKISLETKEVV